MYMYMYMSKYHNVTISKRKQFHIYCMILLHCNSYANCKVHANARRDNSSIIMCMRMRARRRTYIGGLVRLLGGALGLARRVAEREDDWSIVERAHVVENLVRERARHRGAACKHERRGARRRGGGGGHMSVRQSIHYVQQLNIWIRLL